MGPPTDPPTDPSADPPTDGAHDTENNDAHDTEDDSVSTTDSPKSEAVTSTDSTPAEFDPPTDGTPVDVESAEPHRPAEGTETTSESLRRTLDGLLPEATVDSNWWYWIAAVPVYFLVTLVGGILAAIVFVFAGVLDLVGLGGLASVSTFILFGGIAALFGLLGVVIAIGFPIATYIDARAIESAGGEWTPDPVLWGLLAVVAVLVTNFIVSVPLALYYLYKRHEALGTP